MFPVRARAKNLDRLLREIKRKQANIKMMSQDLSLAFPSPGLNRLIVEASLAVPFSDAIGAGHRWRVEVFGQQSAGFIGVLFSHA